MKLVDPLDKLATATEQYVFLRIEGELKNIFPFNPSTTVPILQFLGSTWVLGFI
jgi:hypothetical protein